MVVWAKEGEKKSVQNIVITAIQFRWRYILITITSSQIKIDQEGLNANQGIILPVLPEIIVVNSPLGWGNALMGGVNAVKGAGSSCFPQKQNRC